MYCSTTSLCSPASSYLHHSFSLPFLLNTNHTKTHLPLSSPTTQQNSHSINQTGITLIHINRGLTIQDDDEKLNLDKGISGFHLQGLLDKIKALPVKQTIGVIDFIKKDYRFETISCFNKLLMALLVENEVELALGLYTDVSSFSLEPDCGTYSLLIRCYCKKDDPFEANIVLNDMMGKGFRPNVATFTELINSFCKRGRMQKASEVMKVMGQVGCEPTVNTYNCLLKGLCYVGRVEEAYEMLMNIKKSGKKLDIYTFTAVMNGFCKVGRSSEALELLDVALEMGLVPNVVTYNTLLNGYFVEGRPLEGIGLLNQMRERNCMPDYISYSTLLHGLLKWGNIHAALRIYQEMLGVGFEMDERMMNALLRALCRRSRTEKDLLKSAYELFERMTSRTYVIYPCAYDLVIEAFCIGKHLDKALDSLREMLSIGHSPRIISFNNVIQALCVEGKLREALSVLVLMYEDGKITSAFPFDVLIKEFNQQGMPFSASNVYGAALKMGVVPHRKPQLRWIGNVDQRVQSTGNIFQCSNIYGSALKRA